MKRPRVEEGEVEVNFLDRVKILTLPINTTPTRTITSEINSQHQFSARAFDCKTCNRRFPSFQALGGHCASHKKPKIQLIVTNNSHKKDYSLTKLQRTHECSVCGLEFSNGQALGGHMRRHRGIAVDGFLTASTAGTTRVNDSYRRKRLDLDLNLMPPSDNEAEVLLLTFNGRTSGHRLIGFP